MRNSRQLPLGAHLLGVACCLMIGLVACGQASSTTRAVSLSSSSNSSNNNNNTKALPARDGRYSNAREREENTAATASNQNTSMTLYKEPSSWLVNILKEMFSDIDWQAIDKARVQIEKFIHKVDRIVGSFRSIISKATSGASESRSRDGRWWNSGDKSTASALKGDVTSVKEMLERVACFVGYVRLMNLSNEALAELDASKVVSNLFGSAGAGGAKRNSSLWSWLG